MEKGLQGSKGGSRKVSEEATATVLAGEARAGWGAGGGGGGASVSGSALKVESTREVLLWEVRDTGT